MALGFGAIAQPKKAKLTTVNTPAFDATLLSGVKYRMIGPFRGGRSAAAVGSVQSRKILLLPASCIPTPKRKGWLFMAGIS
jgi:hypothetical protein